MMTDSTRTDAIAEELCSQRNSVFDQFGTIIANLRGELAVANARIQELEAAHDAKYPPVEIPAGEPAQTPE